MAAVEEEDPDQVRAALVLVSLRNKKLRRRPEWITMPPSGEASSSAGTVAAAAKVMMPSAETPSAGTLAARRPERVLMPSGEASSSAGAVAAAAKVMMPSRETSPAGTLAARRPVRVLMQSGDASLVGTVAVRVPERWPKAKRSASRGETSKEQGHAAAAKGSAASSCEAGRCAATPAASAQGRPVVAALYCTAVARSGPSTSVAPAKGPMKTPSPDSPLDYCTAGSGAPSSTDDAALGQRQAKRKGGSVDGDDEGCSSPAKRGPVAEEEKPIPISAGPGVQSGTLASSSGKGAPLPFDLNLPCTLDEDDDGCPDTT